jgi:hypothetical protein
MDGIVDKDAHTTFPLTTQNTRKKLTNFTGFPETFPVIGVLSAGLKCRASAL